MGGGGSKNKVKGDSQNKKGGKSNSKQQLGELESIKINALTEKINVMLNQLPYLNQVKNLQLLESLAHETAISSPLAKSHGEKIIIKGKDNSAGIFYVLEGFVDICSKNEDAVYARLGEGSFFGELSVLFQTISSASVVSFGNSVLLVVQKEKIRLILEDEGLLNTNERDKLKWMTERRYFDTGKEWEGGKC